MSQADTPARFELKDVPEASIPDGFRLHGGNVGIPYWCRLPDGGYLDRDFFDAWRATWWGRWLQQRCAWVKSVWQR